MSKSARQKFAELTTPEKPKTTPYRRSFGPFLFIGGLIWLIFVTLISIATVGYEYQSRELLDFNSTVHLWYDKFIPRSQWISEPKVCEGSTLKVSESSSLLKRS